MRLVEGEKYHAQHLRLGRGFAGPEFELARTLVDEHFNALNGGDAAGLGLFQEWSIQRVLDQIEDQSRLPCIRLQRQVVGVAGHAAGSSVDEHVKFAAGNLLEGDRLRARADGKFFGTGFFAAPDEDIRALFTEAVDRGASCAAGSEDQNPGPLEGDALFQRANDAGGKCSTRAPNSASAGGRFSSPTTRSRTSGRAAITRTSAGTASRKSAS